MYQCITGTRRNNAQQIFFVQKKQFRAEILRLTNAVFGYKSAMNRTRWPSRFGTDFRICRYQALQKPSKTAKKWRLGCFQQSSDKNKHNTGNRYQVGTRYLLCMSNSRCHRSAYEQQPCPRTRDNCQQLDNTYIACASNVPANLVQ